MDLERKLRAALSESRLLILGTHVLFGFQFESAFQELFSDLPLRSRLLQCGGVGLLLISVGLLIAPSLQHQIVYAGESRRGALTAATHYAGVSLLPLILGLGVSAFITLGHLFGDLTGVVAGLAFTGVGLALLYGLGMFLRIGRQMPEPPPEPRETPLKVKIEQLLTEARLIIPGGQALLGFQFIATLTKAFAELTPATQHVHVAGLCAVALAVMLLMTPAAVHRIAYHGEDSAEFFRLASKLVIAATVPLAIGIAADVYVVFVKVTDSVPIGVVAGVAGLLLLIGLWLAYPYWRRARRQEQCGAGEQRG